MNHAAELLREAAQVIDRNGWVQDHWFVTDDRSPAGCRVCAVGAINLAYDLRPDDIEHTAGARYAALEALAAHLDSNIADRLAIGAPADLDDFITVIGIWNDNPNRTAGQVTAALRACAEALPEEVKT